MAIENNNSYSVLSLRGRLVVALCCVEMFCNSRKIDHIEVQSYLDWMWQFVSLAGSGAEFDSWLGNQAILVDAALGYEFPDGFEEFLKRENQSLDEFRRIIGFTAEIIFTSLYSAPDNEKSLRYLEKVILCVKEYSIAPPPVKLFDCCTWHESAWGRILSHEEAMLWRQRGVC